MYTRPLRLLRFLLLLVLTRGTGIGSATAQGLTGSSQYRDILTVGNQVWALTRAGSIRIITPDATAPTAATRQLQADAMCKDAHGNVILLQGSTAAVLPHGATAGQRVLSVKPAAATNVLGLLCNSRGDLFTIKPTGIVAAATGKTYFPKSSPNHQIRLNHSWHDLTAYFMDSADRIWVGFGYGEWGGNVFVFDTRKNEFLPLDLGAFRIELNPVMSIFEGNSTVYLSSGLHHFFAHGSIVGFEQLKARPIFESSISRDSTLGNRAPVQSGEYIGPGAFNAATQALYFYSQHGIFRGKLTADLSKLTNWTNVAQPELRWRSGQKNAVGSPMNVHKLLFTADNKLVFLHDKGIGVLQGSSLLMFD